MPLSRVCTTIAHFLSPLLLFLRPFLAHHPTDNQDRKRFAVTTEGLV